VECYDTLTGFKYIAEQIKLFEGKKTFIAGGEESYGYLAGEFVRDKDAVISCALLAETTAFAKENGKSLFDQLVDIYLEHGFYKEKLLSITRKGKEGEEEIKRMMDGFRNNPPDSINGSDLMLIHDYLKQKTIDQLSHRRHKIILPQSNVLQFILKDSSKISMRPSGTEPKIKFYISVKEKLENRDNFEQVDRLLEDRIENIVKELNIK
jgi:phosphoglucomutase